jgi:hypothetical protein
VDLRPAAVSGCGSRLPGFALALHVEAFELVVTARRGTVWRLAGQGDSLTQQAVSTLASLEALMACRALHLACP